MGNFFKSVSHAVSAPVSHAVQQVTKKVAPPSRMGSTARTSARSAPGSANAGFQGISNISGGGGNNGGMPQYPGFKSPYGNLDMLSKKDVTLNARPDIQLDQRGLNAYRNEALTPSDQSPWLKNQMQQIALQRRQGIDTANAASAGQTAMGRTSLAAHGGLTGGAAERLAMSGGRNAALAGQGVRQNSQNLGLLAGQTAEQNRLNMLQGLPGQELAALQPQFANRDYATGVDRYNIGNVLSDVANKRNYDLGKYGIDAQTYAANQMSDALMNAGQRNGTFNQFMGGDTSGLTNSPWFVPAATSAGGFGAGIAAGGGNALKKAFGL